MAVDALTTRHDADGAARVRHRLLGAVCAMVSVAVPPFLVAVLAVQIEHSLGFTTTQLGAGVAAYFLVSAVMSPVMGRTVERRGAVRLLRLSCGMSTAGLLVIAAAPNATTIVVLLALLGVPNAVAQPAATHVITTVTDVRARAFAFGLVQASIPATTLLTGLVLAAFHGVSWRISVLVVAALTVLAQIAIRAVGPDPQPLMQPAASGAPTDERGGVPAHRTGRFLLLMAAGGFLLSFAAQCLPSFLVLTGLRTGLHATAVAAVQIAASLASITARIVVAARAARSDAASNVASVVVLAAAGAVGFALLAVGSAPAFVIGALVAYGCGWGWSGLFNLSVSRARPGRAAASTGVTQGGIFLGGSLGPLAFAGLLALGNTPLAWGGAAVSASLAACCVAAARRQWTGAHHAHRITERIAP